MNRTLLIHAAASLALSAAAAIAQAQSSGSYLVEHHFDYRPNGDVVVVTGYDFRHAWAVRTGAAPDSAVVHLNQDPDFDDFGTEGWGAGPGGAALFNSGIGSPVSCVYANFNIPPAGVNGSVCLTADASPTLGVACTSYLVLPYSTTPPFRIQGTISSSGSAIAALPGRGAAFAYAYSSAAIAVRGGTQLASGFIQWTPAVQGDVIGAGTGASALRDPIQFVATNLTTGDVVEASLLDFDIQSDGNGTTDWSGGVFHTEQSELDFVIDIPQAHVAPGQTGRVEFRIRNGRVSAANSTGRFAGMLPPVGTVVPVTFPLPQNFDLDFDLGLDPNFPWDVDVDLSGGGGTNPGIDNQGCPADLNDDGVLDFFDVLLFLELFDAGDPAANFNGDDELNFFDVLLFLEIFASNCP